MHNVLNATSNKIFITSVDSGRKTSAKNILIDVRVKCTIIKYESTNKSSLLLTEFRINSFMYPDMNCMKHYLCLENNFSPPKPNGAC